MGKMKAHAQALWEVQEYTLCDGYINNWSYTDDKGETIKSTFETREAAEWALNGFIADCMIEVNAGEMPDAPEWDDFRIVEVSL